MCQKFFKNIVYLIFYVGITHIDTGRNTDTSESVSGDDDVLRAKKHFSELKKNADSGRQLQYQYILT